MASKSVGVFIIIFIVVGCGKTRPYQQWILQNKSDYYWADSIFIDTMFSNGGINKIKGYRNGVDHGYELDFYFDGSIKRIAFWRKGQQIGEERLYSTSGHIEKFNFYDVLGRLRYCAIFNKQGSAIKEKGELLTSTIIETTTASYFSKNDTAIFEVFSPRIKDFEKSQLIMNLYRNGTDSLANLKSEKLNNINNYQGVFTSSGKWIWSAQVIGKDDTLLDSQSMHFLIK